MALIFRNAVNVMVSAQEEFPTGDGGRRIDRIIEFVQGKLLEVRTLFNDEGDSIAPDDINASGGAGG